MLLPHNQALLDLLSNGESITYVDSEGVQERNQVSIPAQIQVSASGDRLSFGSQDDVSAFLDYLEYLTDNWDYSNSDQWDDTPQEINHLGDEALNAVEDYLGYTSLRSHYNLLEWYDEDFESSLNFYIATPDMQMVLNQNHVVEMAGDCYKYLSPSIVAIITRCDKDALQLVEELGTAATGPNITIFDENTGKPIQSNEVELRDGECNLFLTVAHDVDGDYRRIKLESTLLGGLPGPACGVSFLKVEWGDGFTAQNLDVATVAENTHTYDEVLEPGQCKNFTIKVSALPIVSCGGCDGGKLYEEEMVVNICRPATDCTDIKRHNTAPKFYFTYNGNEYRIDGKMGQHLGSIIIKDQLWAKTVFRKKKNGNYKKRKPNKKLIARVHGSIFLNECTLEKNVDHDKRKRKKRVKVKKRFDEHFGTSTEEGLMFLADFQAKMDDNGGVFGITDFHLIRLINHFIENSI